MNEKEARDRLQVKNARDPKVGSAGGAATRGPRGPFENWTSAKRAAARGNLRGVPQDARFGDGLPEVKSVWPRDARLRRSLSLVDVAATAIALAVAVGVGGVPAASALPLLLMVPLVVVANKALGLYDRDEHLLRKTTLDELPRLFHMAVLVSFVVSLASGSVLGAPLPAAAVVALFATDLAATAVGRRLARAFVMAITPGERCVVMGSAAAADRFAAKVESSDAVTADVIGRIAVGARDYERSPSGMPLLGGLDSLPELVSTHGVERAILVADRMTSDELLHALRRVKSFGVKVSVVPRLLEAVGSAAVFDDVDGMTLLGVRGYGLTKSSRLLKRAVDVVGVALCLSVLGPLLVFIAIAIKLDSGGPVFFRQRRIGRSGESFWMIKFRSMADGADAMKERLIGLNEADGLFKIADDPRVTRVGRWLRRTSLDELPQLLNVLRGDMALVGPRPLVPDEDARIGGWERRRLIVRPGMTGQWQILGSARIPMHEMVKIDYMYGANWSIWLDLKILARTVPYVLSRRGM